MGLMSRTITLAVLVVVSIATTCSASTAIAIAPPPATSLDSAARSAYSLAARVTGRHGLKRYEPSEPVKPLTCFAKETLFLCGKVNAPEIQFLLYQTRTTGFLPWADSVRLELLDSLRAEFGEGQVRECKWQTKRHGCAPAAMR
jgi:hypothetical protein